MPVVMRFALVSGGFGKTLYQCYLSMCRPQLPGIGYGIKKINVYYTYSSVRLWHQHQSRI